MFPREQLLILKTEDYSSNRLQHLKQVFKFLELGDGSLHIMRSFAILWIFMVAQCSLSDDIDATLEERIMTRQNSNKMPSRYASKIGRMLPQTERMLRDFFAPFHQQLADVIGDDRFRFEGQSL